MPVSKLISGILGATMFLSVPVFPSNGAVKPAAYALRDGTLFCGTRPILQRVPDGFALVPDRTGAGVFVRLTVPAPTAHTVLLLGTMVGLQRFASCHRDEPWWMLQQTGRAEQEVQLETQWLLGETAGGDCVMLVPLMDGPMVFTLSGGTNGLRLHGMTGDPAVTVSGGVALFVSVGSDPYAMVRSGSAAVMKQLGTGKLAKEKPLPDFVNDFGWCTWDSFYKEVSASKVRAGLQSFVPGGVEPRFLIVDDGWQDYKLMPSGEERLVSLMPNQERFAGDLKPTVELAKKEFKVRTVLAWHAMMGYWGGVDSKSLSAYDVRDQGRDFSPEILAMVPVLNTNWWGHLVGVVPGSKIADFYNDYHGRLKRQGVDGVKVDTQTAVEGVAAGLGGRVALTLAYRKALEDSVNKHFHGRLINCMACSMETFYCSPGSTLVRSSVDFWPKRPASHGQHLCCNAMVGMWFGEFMRPDWDMFQSGHVMGSFHAAGRAVSGGPVYVSDTPDAHDFELLRKLVLSDGGVLRADQPGRPTRDCLFSDPTREPTLLKVFNYNRDCAIIGAFNANYHTNEELKKPIAGTVSPSDAPELKGEDFAAFFQNGNRVWRCQRAERAPVRLAEGTWELISLAPVERGVAVLGLADKFNSTGAVVSRKWNGDRSLQVSLRDGGSFIAWAEKAPREMTVAGKNLPFSHDAATGRLSAAVPPGRQAVLIRW